MTRLLVCSAALGHSGNLDGRGVGNFSPSTVRSVIWNVNSLRLAGLSVVTAFTASPSAVVEDTLATQPVPVRAHSAVPTLPSLSNVHDFNLPEAGSIPMICVAMSSSSPSLTRVWTSRNAFFLANWTVMVPSALSSLNCHSPTS
jgi:hypothetical protein